MATSTEMASIVHQRAEMRPAWSAFGSVAPEQAVSVAAMATSAADASQRPLLLHPVITRTRPRTPSQLPLREPPVPVLCDSLFVFVSELSAQLLGPPALGRD